MLRKFWLLVVEVSALDRLENLITLVTLGFPLYSMRDKFALFIGSFLL